MNDAMRALAIGALVFALTACGSDSDDSQVSNDGNGGQVDNGNGGNQDPDDQINTGDDAGGGGDGGSGDDGQDGSAGDGPTDDGSTDDGSSGDGSTGDGSTGENPGGGDDGTATDPGAGDDGTDNGGSDGSAGIANSAFAYAQSRSDLSTFVSALEAADQKNTLSNAGAYTILAPDNIAFDRLFAELNVTPEQLFSNRELLSKVVRYHMIGSNLKAADLPLSRPLTTYEGSVIKVEQNAIQPIIFDGRGRLARVTTTDLDTANATIHVIDRVMLPAQENVVELARARDDLSLFAEALSAADLAGLLSGEGPFTVLAPDNDAIVAALSELGLTKDQLLSNDALLRQVLSYHVIPGTFYRAELPFNQPLRTLEGSNVVIDDQFPPRVTDAQGRVAQLKSIDTITTNGVVHILDKVILPAE